MKIQEEIYNKIIEISTKFMEGNRIDSVNFPKLKSRLEFKDGNLIIKDYKNKYFKTTNNIEKIANELYTYFCDVSAIEILEEIKHGTVHAKYVESWLEDIYINLFKELSVYL